MHRVKPTKSAVFLLRCRDGVKNAHSINSITDNINKTFATWANEPVSIKKPNITGTIKRTV